MSDATTPAELQVTLAPLDALAEAGGDATPEHVRAIAAPVVAAELRRLAFEMRDGALELDGLGMLSSSEQNVYARNIRDLRARADELDPSSPVPSRKGD